MQIPQQLLDALEAIPPLADGSDRVVAVIVADRDDLNAGGPEEGANPDLFNMGEGAGLALAHGLIDTVQAAGFPDLDRIYLGSALVDYETAGVVAASDLPPVPVEEPPAVEEPEAEPLVPDDPGPAEEPTEPAPAGDPGTPDDTELTDPGDAGPDVSGDPEEGAAG